MKNSIVLALGLIAGACLPASAQNQPLPQISVSGSAEVKVVPDEVQISVGIETRDENLDEARRQHDLHMAEALAFLKKSGVPDKYVQTDFISVEPQFDTRISYVKPVAYVVRKSIEVKLTNVTNMEPVLTGLLNSGVNYIHNVNFRTTELRKYRDEARAMAIKAAKEKAVAMTGGLGVKCGKPCNINANEYGGWWNYSSGSNWGGRNQLNSYQNAVQNFNGSAEAAGETLAVGQISVSATVNVSFLIE